MVYSIYRCSACRCFTVLQHIIGKVLSNVPDGALHMLLIHSKRTPSINVYVVSDTYTIKLGNILSTD